jgi:predicted metal-dependent enzyme (double-stranded beta helix superfamily)
MPTSAVSVRSRSDLHLDPARGVQPGRLAARLAADQQLWRPQVRFAHPRHYIRLLAHPDWEAWLLTWLPGQSTGLHDHGGSAGAFAVLDGVLDETVLASEGGRLGRRSRAYAQGQVRASSEGGRLGRRSRAYARGQVRAFGCHHVHDVEPASGPAISLHVYAPALTGMTRYALEDGVLVELATEQAGADW